MFSRVLVPLDGTGLAEGILPYVSQIARGLDIPVVLLSVVDPEEIELPQRMAPREAPEGPRLWRDYFPGLDAFKAREIEPRHRQETLAPGDKSGGPFVSQILEAVETEATSRLERVVQRLESEGVRARPMVSVGWTAQEIVRVAEREGCDLVAMSTRGRSQLARHMLGSVADKVIHASKVPTLTVSPEVAEKYRKGDVAMSRIMVPLDGSALAETALPYVAELAKALSLKVMLVRVVKVGGAYWAFPDGYPYPGALDIEVHVETDATEYLKGVANRLRAGGLGVQWKLLRGSPAHSIVELARETPHDMIALTSHGRTGFPRWALGSVAEALVRASGDPVLVVPARRADGE